MVMVMGPLYQTINQSINQSINIRRTLAIAVLFRGLIYGYN